MERWEVELRSDLENPQKTLWGDHNIKTLLDEISRLRDVIEAQETIINHLNHKLINDVCVNCGE